MGDREVVARQLGRAPQGDWRVVARCPFGRPTVIATAPLVGGQPFPTLYYLTCPQLASAVCALESAGEAEGWRQRLAADEALRERLLRADDAYRAARRDEGGGEDPASSVGIAGQRDPLGIKCLHAHLAAYLAGIDDPVGEAVYAVVERECTDDQCGEER